MSLHFFCQKQAPVGVAMLKSKKGMLLVDACGDVTRKKDVNVMPHSIKPCGMRKIRVLDYGTMARLYYCMSACGTFSHSFCCPRATFWDGFRVWNNFLGWFLYVEQLFGTDLKRKGHSGVVQEVLRARSHRSARYNFLGRIGS